jgi:hypothetical protein
MGSPGRHSTPEGSTVHIDGLDSGPVGREPVPDVFYLTVRYFSVLFSTFPFHTSCFFWFVPQA